MFNYYNNSEIKRLCEILTVVPVINHSMTTDELIECLGCHIDDEGEIINSETGKPTGVWYEDIERAYGDLCEN